LTSGTVGIGGIRAIVSPPRVVVSVVVACGAGSAGPTLERSLLALKTLSRDGAGKGDSSGVENEEEVGDREHSVVNSKC